MSEQPDIQSDVLANPLQTDPSVLGGPAMGLVSVETVPQPSEFSRLIDGLSELTIRLNGDSALEVQKKDEALDNYLNTNRVQEVITEGNYTAKDLSYFLEVAADVYRNTGYLLTTVLTTANRSALDEVCRSGDANLIELLQGAMDYIAQNNSYFTYHQTAIAIEQITMGVDGRMIDWVRQSRMDPFRETSPIPSWIRRELMSDPRFPAACANSEYYRILQESEGKTLQNRLKLRKAEKEILEAFGVSEQMSKDFRLSLRARTVPTKDNGTLREFNEVGGIDGGRWVRNIGDYCQNVRALRTSEAEILHRACGVVNFDRYSTELLYNQLRLLDRLSLTPGAEAMHEPPRDITVVIADAFGDYNGAANHLFESFDPKSTLVFEMHKPEDLPAYFELLKKMNIKPSTLVLNTHGNEGYLAYNQGSDTFFITSYKTKNPNARHIKTLGIGQFIQEGMQPHSLSKEREIMLYSCHGAQGTDYADPIAEAIIKETEWWDRAVVKAAEEAIAIEATVEGNNELFYKSRPITFIERTAYRLHEWRPMRRLVPLSKRPLWEPAQVHEFRRGLDGMGVIRSRREKGTPVRTVYG